MADQPDPNAPRQKVVRIEGSRRARLTPVPGTDPDIPDGAQRPASVPRGKKGPNDDRLIEDVPPHY